MGCDRREAVPGRWFGGATWHRLDVGACGPLRTHAPGLSRPRALHRVRHRRDHPGSAVPGGARPAGLRPGTRHRVPQIQDGPVEVEHDAELVVGIGPAHAFVVDRKLPHPVGARSLQRTIGGGLLPYGHTPSPRGSNPSAIRVYLPGKEVIAPVPRGALPTPTMSRLRNERCVDNAKRTHDSARANGVSPRAAAGGAWP